MVASLEAQLKTVKKGIANSGDAAQARAVRASTRAELQERHTKLQEEKASILKKSWDLFFKVTSGGKGCVDGMGSGSGGTGSSGSDGLVIDMAGNRQMLEGLIAAGANLALQRHQQQQQQQQQQAALQNGGMQDSLSDIKNKMSEFGKIREAAVQHLIDDPTTYEGIRDEAVETLLRRKSEDVILEAAARIKRARRIEEEEEEEESDEDE